MNRVEAGRLGGYKTRAFWIAKYNNNPKRCCFCGKSLPWEKRKNKYCSQSCAAKCIRRVRYAEGKSY